MTRTRSAQEIAAAMQTLKEATLALERCARYTARAAVTDLETEKAR